MNPKPALLPVLLAVASAAQAVEPASLKDRAAAVDFVRDVQPLLADRCVKCHGAEKQKGGLRLDVREPAFRGGESREPAIVPGDAAKSHLFTAITSQDKDERMPPKGDPLTAAQIALLKAWIEGGAVWPDAANAAGGSKSEMIVTEEDRKHWAFAPLRITVPPKFDAGGGADSGNGVDGFWRAPLRARGLAPAAEAPRDKLIRRVSLDLNGLPPTPEEVQAFVNDPAADAYERLVDRLLASPRFGERWARHWLDVARYADSCGYENDSDRPTAWHYRDFVIRAFNDDLPFNTFIRWQLAGDEDEPANPLARAATAFLGLGPVVESDTKLKDELARYRYAELDDMISTTSAAMLGLTVGCARCHDHKYDPIPTRDYYRMLSAFVPVRRTEFPLAAKPPEMAGEKPKVVPTIFSVTEASAKAEKNFLMARGDPTSPKEEVELGFLTVLGGAKTAQDYLHAHEGSRAAATTTQQRTALADWMTDAHDGAGALLARVIVNRLWQHHFGEGLVRTPSDFGTQGDAPSHPELLDWLAGELIRGGWRLKPIHRLMLLSAAYRQDTACAGGGATADPENRLLWHRRPMRIEAEIFRDSILAVSGCLNDEMGGAAVKAPLPDEVLSSAGGVVRNPYPKGVKDTPETWRRSVYLFTKRSARQPLLEVLDGANPNESCARRIPTTVAPQALAMLNDGFIRARARDFAARLAREAGDDVAEQVRHAYALALGRAPTEMEGQTSRDFVARQQHARAERQERDAVQTGLADFCHALFGLNEFIYVD